MKLIKQYKEQLKAHNLKLTDKRLKLIEILEGYDKYLSAKELQQQLVEIFPGISYDTIYRNLHTLTDIGVLEQTTLDGEMNYKIACSEHHHHHFICERCGETQVITYCPVDTWQRELPDVKLNSHKVELYGYCGECR